MSSLFHIVAIAAHMLDQFGDGAALVATQRAHHHRVCDEHEGFALWQQVGTAVRELQRLRRSP